MLTLYSKLEPTSASCQFLHAEPEFVNVSGAHESIPTNRCRHHMYRPASAGIFKQSMEARNRERMGYRTGPSGYIGCMAKLIPWSRFLASIKVKKKSGSDFPLLAESIPGLLKR
jgi:hypothetical protein